jgi:chromosome segregation ATPase
MEDMLGRAVDESDDSWRRRAIEKRFRVIEKRAERIERQRQQIEDRLEAVRRRMEEVALRGQRHRSGLGQRGGELGEDGQVGVQPEPLDAADPQG